MAKHQQAAVVEREIVPLQDDEGIDIPGTDASGGVEDKPVTMSDMAALIAELRRGNDAVAAAAPIRKIPFSQYKPVSVFNPTGSRGRKLTRKYYQNGRKMIVDLLKDPEVELLNQLVPGRFIEGLVVVEVRAGEAGDTPKVFIGYKNKAVEQRMNLKGEAKDLETILRRCVNESKAVQVA